jgi:maltose O-acetyltransferase
MSTERQKMIAGEMYDPFDPELVAGRALARDLCQRLNATRESEEAERRRILRELFGKGGDSVWMQPPFYCDYGANIELGERVFFNFNCIVLDVCPVRIGDLTLFGAAVQIDTPLHPFNAEQRRREEFGDSCCVCDLCDAYAGRPRKRASACLATIGGAYASPDMAGCDP